jgi:hypothetical protein
VRPAPRIPAPPLLDTLTLAPASALAHRSAWQRMARGLPAGSVLIVTVPGSNRISDPVDKITRAFQTHGHPVTTVTVTQLTERQLLLL